MEAATDNTQRKQSGLKPFKPGQSGNPAGRPKGARSKLAEAFVDALLADWKENGVEAIVAMREDKPADYVKVVASLLPKEITGEDGGAILVTRVELIAVQPE